MPLQQYPFPDFLEGRVTTQQYGRWLQRKAAAHVKRDRKRLSIPVVLSTYKRLIHTAVCTSGGVDWYTGEPLLWELISTYDNEKSKADRSHYKAGFALLPTIDHVLGDDGKYDFVICGWRTNDAKNDLSLDEFLTVCQLVLARHG
jgi:hypothetical protein